MDALRCKRCLRMQPRSFHQSTCGQSAHAELGWAAAAGKLTAAWCPAIREPDLMLRMASYITDEWDAIERWLLAVQSARS